MTHEIRQGYKHTPLGWIPDDWEAKQLKLCANILFSNVDKHIIEGEKEVLLCNYMDVYKNEYIFSGISFSKGTVKEAEYEKFKLKKGDVIITKDSEDRRDIAVPAYVIEDVPNLVCGYHLAVIRPQKKVLDGLYLSQTLRSHHVNFYFQKRANGITRVGLDTNTVRTSIIPLPSLPEQQKIAEILSAWDEAIALTEELVKRSEHYLKWLEQNLLSGKIRLKGFSSRWNSIYINDLANEKSIKNKNNKPLTVLSCTKYNGLIPSLEYFGRRVFGENLRTYKIVPKNHFAYATNHIEEGSIGYQEIFEEALISPMYTVFETKSTNDYFLFKLLKSHRLIHEYNSRMEGSIDRRGGLRWDSFSKIKIRIPNLTEQNAISDVLKSTEIKIQLLKKKQLSLINQKKGLMQNLLKGEIRVKI